VEARYVERFTKRFQDQAASRLILSRELTSLCDADLSALLSNFRGKELKEAPSPEDMGPLAKRLPGLAKAFARLII
jgi:hypothetical protein